MSHQASRPIVVTFDDTDDPIYVPISREREYITITGETTGTEIQVDYTLENIVRSQASSYDVHGSPIVAPANANWETLQATLAATPVNQQLRAFALRLNMTGTGISTVRIMQSV